MSCDVCKGINSSRCPVCGTGEREDECPHCNGTGVDECWAVCVDTGEKVKVTSLAWITLPWFREEAVAKGKRQFRGMATDCPYCDGSGLLKD